MTEPTSRESNTDIFAWGSKYSEIHIFKSILMANLDYQQIKKKTSKLWNLEATHSQLKSLRCHVGNTIHLFLQDQD